MALKPKAKAKKAAPKKKAPKKADVRARKMPVPRGRA